jgi:hypothetical protein
VSAGFYLSGGTAASRGYLHHRFSDDLDLFVNTKQDWRMVQWIEAPDLRLYLSDLRRLG